jgi:Flp pilus assembly protein TadD
MKRLLYEKLGGLRVDLEPDAAIAELSARCEDGVVLAGQSVAYQARTSSRHGIARAVVHAATTEPQPFSDIKNLRERASEALKAGQLSTVEALLLDIESAEPDDADSWVLWGVLHMQRGDFVEAERRFRGVAERGGDEIKGGTGVALAFSGMGRSEEAWDHLQPLADRFPQSADVLHAVFRTGVALGKFDALRGRLEPYVDGSPDDDDLRFALATVCVRLGDAATAGLHYTRLQQRVPDYVGLDELAERLTGGRS